MFNSKSKFFSCCVIDEIAAAQQHGLGNELVEELMRAYFCEEKFINDR